jgi:hypothetical protein
MATIVNYDLLSQLPAFQSALGEGPIVDANPCGCPPGDAIGLERTRYFGRQVVGPDDLTADQRYFRDKHRRHNRLLHGWGVLCGAGVEADPDDDCGVIIAPGYLLGPWGDEIVIPHRVRVNLCKQDADGQAVPPCGGADPWCSDVRVDRRDDEPLYVAVRYADCDTRPVRVTGCSCGCDETECEYSRTRDSYAIRVLTELPSSHSDTSRISMIYGLLWGNSCLGGKVRACPPCPAEPWIVLADVTLSDGKVKTIDCFAHRRYIASMAMFAFHCGTRTGVAQTLPESKQYALVDINALEGTAPAAPAATVAVRLGDRWMSVPAAFEVQDGDTVATLLAREGGRRLLDPDNGDVITLRELYAAAEVDPATPVRSRGDALIHLEGRRLDVTGVRAVTSSLTELLGPDAAKQLADEHAGAPGHAGELAASRLPGVDAETRLGGRLGDRTIAEVAAQDRERFIEDLIVDEPDEQRARSAERAGALWDTAARVARLADAWRESQTREPRPPDA